MTAIQLGPEGGRIEMDCGGGERGKWRRKCARLNRGLYDRYKVEAGQ